MKIKYRIITFFEKLKELIKLFFIKKRIKHEETEQEYLITVRKERYSIKTNLFLDSVLLYDKIKMNKKVLFDVMGDTFTKVNLLGWIESEKVLYSSFYSVSTLALTDMKEKPLSIKELTTLLSEKSNQKK